MRMATSYGIDATELSILNNSESNLLGCMGAKDMEKIPREVFEKKAHEQGYRQGLIMAELKTTARINKEVKAYIKKHKELKPYEGDLLNIIYGRQP